MKAEEEIFEFRIRGFRADQSLKDCLSFAKGHQQVLIDHGFQHIASNNTEWVDDQNIYVLVAESLDGRELLGGVRIKKRTNSNELDLETALKTIDHKVSTYVEQLLDEGLGEICGLWNSKRVAGYRISYILVRTAIGIMQSLGLSRAISFLAKYTIYIAQDMGFRQETELGDNGVFYYPNENFVAGVHLNDNFDSGQYYDETAFKFIQKLRSQLNQGTFVTEEETKWNKHFRIYYELDL